MYFHYDIPEEFKWFPESRYGVFIHWGPYSLTGRGEQALFRDHMDQAEYEKMACSWNPQDFDAEKWARELKKAGFKYACLTTRHHDGYCLWDCGCTDYTSMKQAPGRDFVREYTDAFRKEGLKVGLYYSWCDWRIPAYYEGPQKDPAGWQAMKDYIWTQVEELCTKYGKIDYFFFDGVWPRNAEDFGSRELVGKMRLWQPGIMINNRLGFSTDPEQLLQHGGGDNEGDFGTPEHNVNPEKRLWEACRVSYQRWWGYHSGERFKTEEEMLDLLCDCASRGGNLLLNVGPEADGKLPQEFLKKASKIGEWLALYGEAIYGNDGGDMTEALTYGYQTIKENSLYLIMRFWDGREDFRLADLESEVISAELMGTGKRLEFDQTEDVLILHGLPQKAEGPLYPVIKITSRTKPSANEWGRQRLWEGDPERVALWAKSQRGQKGFHV